MGAIISAIHTTTIEWCTDVWNPVVGCLRRCVYCYAWRPGCGIAWRFAEVWTRLMGRTGVEAEETIDKFKRFIPQFFPERMGLRHPKGKVIFVNSMSDPEYWKPEWMQAVLDEIAQHPENTYIMLSKSPRYLEGYTVPDNLKPGITITQESDITDVHRAFIFRYGNNFVLNIEPLHGSIGKRGQALLNMCPDAVIIGAETGKRPGRIVPEKAWVDEIVRTAEQIGLCNILIPIHIKPSIYTRWPEYDRPEYKEVIR